MMNCMPYYNIINYKSVKIEKKEKINNKSEKVLFLDVYVDRNNIPNNLSNATLCIREEIPKDDIRRVRLVIDGVKYNLMTKSGNWLMSDQLISHIPYLIVYGDNNPHFAVVNCRCIKPTNFTEWEVIVFDGKYLQDDKRRD